MPIGQPELFYHDEALQLAALDDLFVERWTGPPSLDRLRSLIDAHRRFIRAHAPEKTLLLVELTGGEMHMPDASVRALLDERTKAIDEHLSATALVLAATGFSAAALRAIISASSLIRRSRYPYKVFTKLDDAFPWLARQRTGHADGTALARAYTMLERELALRAVR